MKVGLTASRHSCTSGQLHKLRSYLISNMPIEEFHHGCCVVGDTMGHYEAYNLGITIVYHPPTIPDYATDFRDFDGIWRKAKPYLTRNHDIVDETDVLCAMPRTRYEEVRSGTWATIRYARKIGKPVEIFLP